MEKIVFSILRYDPEKDKKPHYQDFDVEIRRPGMMILDGLNQIRWEQDGTLAYRRSCREGVCGSDGVNVNGVNMLTCVTHITEVVKKGRLVIQPLPSLPLVKDLVVDLDDFFNKYFTVKPYLISKTPPPHRERLQSPAQRKKLDGLYECILCACCSSSCPSYWANPEYLGPSAMLNVARFVEDSRDDGADERLDMLEDRIGVWRCHTILNCVEACPKSLNPTQAIATLKKLLVQRRF
ncbi:succinate dehydrogenase and fumarate reductase iron-sulfur protein [Desulfarculus baarsii DSM 2075]|uniref:Succinate dehydrogenase iron-sulfur subunit n=1 Tax=Desulfarculus baarsii (strain ATCC 33931 / DSM 2075 / LMG 7858 / VKM B-1802 / 2st14) TaxID=644282 RepID=E1QIN3_DESB2|nr:succinate dehydrogenase iron-sulfur subunit [Desulfarculus baarsii]ADK84456.1 succinate dehydrogenase and fumarate reductase iron-sulfur protein [Desulfarculus baarsii DSM 2075]